MKLTVEHVQTIRQALKQEMDDHLMHAKIHRAAEFNGHDHNGIRKAEMRELQAEKLRAAGRALQSDFDRAQTLERRNG